MIPALFLSVVLAAGSSAAGPAVDPIMDYAGAWTVKLSDGRVSHVTDRCLQGSLFIACEQTVDGKVRALLTFRPIRIEDGVREYLATPLNADGAPADATRLRIEGARWTYSFDTLVLGKRRRGRVVNLFTDRDHIHFSIQSSVDGITWTTTLSGDEVRDAAP